MLGGWRTGRGTSGVYGNGSLRYQVDRSLGVGGGGTMRHAGADGGSAYAFVDKITDLGTTRFQVDAVQVQGASKCQQLVSHQAWATPGRLRPSPPIPQNQHRRPANPRPPNQSPHPRRPPRNLRKSHRRRPQRQASRATDSGAFALAPAGRAG